MPVDANEARAVGITAGWPIPSAIADVVSRALAGSVASLIERGVIPSAEVLARLTPQIAATTSALAYPDPALRQLMAANYQAFRNRRSLLLLNLDHQVRLGELPWVAAVAHLRTDSDDSRDNARRVLVRLASLAIDGFPATILPNPLLRELATVATGAGVDVPWVEELAADIFMGRFSGKYLQAAKVAARLLRGTLYERYFGIDYAAVAAISDVSPQGSGAPRGTTQFDVLCHVRSAVAGYRYPVAANGMVIEQAQILTTHNLATLVDLVGVRPMSGWNELARRCLRTVFQLVNLLHRHPRPVATVKDAAYAWRQMVFFLSLAGADEQSIFVDDAWEQLDAQPGHVGVRLRPALAGLAQVGAGGRFNPDGTAGEARRFLGWTTTGHWILDAQPSSA